MTFNKQEQEHILNYRILNRSEVENKSGQHSTVDKISENQKIFRQQEILCQKIHRFKTHCVRISSSVYSMQCFYRNQV